ncbi:MAG: hypothetical protein N3D10_02225 [Candidatus Micrarchaeota archaeon]|nr:hypothetical protein [Candidatus Micrarchaeota archaeon]
MPLEIGLAIVYGLGISIFILALAYMLSSFFYSDFLRAWVKKELADLLFFFGICILLLALFSVLQIKPLSKDQIPFYSGYLSNAKNVHPKIEIDQNISSIKDFLSSQAKMLIKNTFYYLKFSTFNYNYQKGLSTNYLISSSFGAYSYTEGKSYGYGTNLILSQLFFALDFCFSLILLLEGVFAIVMFLSALIVNFLLPFGILLRFIPITKKLGAIIVGYSLSFIFIFPLAVSLSSELFDYSLKLAQQKKFVNLAKELNFPDTELPKKSTLSVWAFALAPLYKFDSSVIAYLIALALSLLGVPIGSPVPNAPDLPTPLLEGSLWSSFIQFLINFAKIYVPIAVGNDIRKTTIFPEHQIIEDFYEPLVEFVLPNLMLIALLIFICIIFQFTFTIILGRQFSSVLGQEGYLFALQRLI